MKDHGRRIGRVRFVALSTIALSIGLQVSAYAASSGSESEIRFYGRIVAPPYSIDASSLSSVSSSLVGATSTSGNAIAVKFSTLAADKPAATVSFYANDTGPVSIGPDARSDVVTRFVDTKGHQIAWQKSRDYYLKQNEGTLTLSIDPRVESHRPEPVTVMVSYQ
ncbi:hypothetical protein [Paraburkholderia sp.]|uniref:hypothetical protein n=1 Tax=Paraburkholderia sp. TaxID=1926495 RepID=UPI003D6DA93B